MSGGRWFLGRHYVRHVGRLLAETGRRWSQNNGPLLAASMSYYAAFSFFPLLLVLIAALGFALRISLGARGAEEALLDSLSRNTAPELARQVSTLLDGVESNAAVSGPIGLATLLLGAIGIFSQLDFAFDQLWQGGAHSSGGLLLAARRALGARLKAFLILAALGTLILAGFAVEVFAAAVETWTEELPGGGYAWRTFDTTGSVVFHALIFTLLYKLLPKANVRWLHALTGGVIVAVVWEVGRRAMAYIIVGKTYTAYGIVGSFIAIMVWVYYASSLLFLGAQFVQVLGKPPSDSGPSA